jgi:dihydroorotate dehydrogenase (fumarate)
MYQPDIDVEKMEHKSGKVFSSPEELSLPLRWVASLRLRWIR